MGDIEIKNGVIIGKKGELFLADGQHRPLDFITGKVDVSEASIMNFQANLVARAEHAAGCGARHVHLVAPDKHTVLKDSFPIDDPIILGDIYRQRVRAPFLFPTEKLRELEHGGYGFADTHWNWRGRLAAVEDVVLGLGLDETMVREQVEALTKLIRPRAEDVAGDLGKRFKPPITQANETLAVNWKVHKFDNQVTSGNDGRMNLLISEHPNAQGRIVIFGDSFIAQALSLFTAFFRDILFCRTQYYHKEIMVGARPNYVLTENVERYLSNVRPDEEAPPLLLMAMLRGNPVNYEKKDLEAFSAVLSGHGSRYKGLVEKLKAE
ncbi:hypothetical protein [Sphingobium sp. WCS2017Hpa-17]|uniref:hypothetical protein n=1 Tax=Sphingobium sp. WCS2017Hpa-17 TaxID=3073638 RepID=UPI0028891FD6|nr:hypothetical protein [Sphingobium sp. WCS2017Hpa-17]